MRRGEIYRSEHPEPERGDKPGYYVVVSRDFVPGRAEIDTVVCAPLYGNVLGIPTEVTVDETSGVRRPSAVRCDFLAPLFKRRLTRLVGSLSAEGVRELDRALAAALDLHPVGGG